eukprot:scaffold253161_cov23-Tisochrysis_lutea.AAC.8
MIQLELEDRVRFNDLLDPRERQQHVVQKGVVGGREGGGGVEGRALSGEWRHVLAVDCVADQRLGVRTASTEDLRVDGRVDNEPVDLDGARLAVAAHAADGLRVARVELLLRTDEQRVEEDAMRRGG